MNLVTFLCGNGSSSLILMRFPLHRRDRDRDRDRDERFKDRDRDRDRDVKPPSGILNNLAAGSGGFLKPTFVHQQTNPFTNLPHTPRYYEILKKRLQLPVWEYRERFTEILMKNQSFVLVGETGSGKTTQVERQIICFCSTSIWNALELPVSLKYTCLLLLVKPNKTFKFSDKIDLIIPLKQGCSEKMMHFKQFLSGVDSQRVLVRCILSSWKQGCLFFKISMRED